MNDSVQRVVRGGERPLGGNAHPHGKPSSWIFVAVIIAAFMAGGIAIIVQSWWLFWLSVGTVLLGMPAASLVRIMDDPAVAEGLPDDRPPGDWPTSADRAPAAVQHASSAR
jgi:hypothetical protein